MWPGFDDEGGAAGDWPVRLVGSAPMGRVGQVIEATAASTGKPYIARITGRDATYTWARQFLKAKWEFPASRANNPAAIVRLVLPVSDIRTLPAALEIRWGPANGPIDSKTGNRMCGYRRFFIMSLDGLKEVQEQHVAWLVDEGKIVAVVGPPKRSSDMRAKINFDEEV